MEKKKYFTPIVELVVLDNEISLTLDSTPPFGPEESILKAPEYFNNEPFKTNLG